MNAGRSAFCSERVAAGASCAGVNMKVLITAGGTSEPIDPVRTITNSSTGRLGVEIARAFAKLENVEKIYYVCGKRAVLPDSEKTEIMPILSTNDLVNAVKKVFAGDAPDAVIHSMAVSDYTVSRVTTLDALAEAAEKAAGGSADFRAALMNAEAIDNTKKVSSYVDDMAVFLTKTPKVISMFKDMPKKPVIVGFKLLSGVPEEELIDVAFNLLRKNECDFVLANDSTQITGDLHRGYLVDAEKNIKQFETKAEIAAGIAKAVTEKLV